MNKSEQEILKCTDAGHEYWGSESTIHGRRLWGAMISLRDAKRIKVQIFDRHADGVRQWRAVRPDVTFSELPKFKPAA